MPRIKRNPTFVRLSVQLSKNSMDSIKALSKKYSDERGYTVSISNIVNEAVKNLLFKELRKEGRLGTGGS